MDYAYFPFVGISIKNGGDAVERVPYRRVTPSRQGSAPDEYSHSENSEDSMSRGETLIIQCIISGIIMVFVLVATMTNIPPAAVAKEGISQVLSGAETLDELIVEVRNFGAEWFGWEEPAVEPTLDFTIPTHDFNDYADIEHTGHEFYDDTEPEYIEETPADEASNQTVPEPAVTPGL